MLIYNTTKVRVGISISLMPLPCVKNLPSARLIFFSLLSQIFFLGIACCFRSVLLSISEWRFKGHHQLAATTMYYTTAVWFNVKKSFCPISRRQGASKMQGKKANNARHAAHTVQNWYSHWNQSLFETVSYIPHYLMNIACSCKVHIF